MRLCDSASSAGGTRRAAQSDAPPEPESAIDTGDRLLPDTTTFAALAPADCGVKLTVTVQLAASFNVAPQSLVCVNEALSAPDRAIAMLASGVVPVLVTSTV